MNESERKPLSLISTNVPTLTTIHVRCRLCCLRYTTIYLHRNTLTPTTTPLSPHNDNHEQKFGSNSRLDKEARSLSAAAVGGSSGLGKFQDTETGSTMTPGEMGRKELFQQIPFLSVLGMQKKEKDVSKAFADYAANEEANAHNELTEFDKEQRRSQASVIILDELEMEKSVMTMPLIFAVFIAATSQFLVGYNNGVMNAPVNVVFPGHSLLSWSLAVSGFGFGGPLGSYFGGIMADSRGRRGALLIDMWTFVLGGTLQALAPNIYVIIVARFIIGFASGFSSVLVPVYLGEMAPPSLRGSLGTLTQFALVIGILVADLLAFPLATPTMWRLLFAVTALTGLFQLLLSTYLLESPRWLLNRDRNSMRARYIIKRLRGYKTDEEVEKEVANFLAGKTEDSEKQESQMVLLAEMFSKPRIRSLIISSIFLQICQQFSGINAVIYYSTSFFQGVISNPLVGTTILGVVNVLATWVALLLMDRCGRKTLLLWSTGVMFLGCIFIVLSMLHVFPNIISLVAMNAYVIFFEIGLGPIPWLIVSEMFGARYIAAAMSVSSQVNWGANFVVGLAFPYMNKYLGPYSFVPFAVALFVSFLHTTFVLPETQGTTPAELAGEAEPAEPNPEDGGAIDEE